MNKDDPNLTSFNFSKITYVMLYDSAYEPDPEAEEFDPDSGDSKAKWDEAAIIAAFDVDPETGYWTKRAKLD